MRDRLGGLTEAERRAQDVVPVGDRDLRRCVGQIRLDRDQEAEPVAPIAEALVVERSDEGVGAGERDGKAIDPQFDDEPGAWIGRIVDVAGDHAIARTHHLRDVGGSGHGDGCRCEDAARASSHEMMRAAASSSPRAGARTRSQLSPT